MNETLAELLAYLAVALTAIIIPLILFGDVPVILASYVTHP